MTPAEKAALATRLRGGREEREISLSPATRVIAIASGKGGVGKSTLTANLAYALSALGEQVGVLDGDVYGHSIPHMLGVHQKPIAVDEMIVPPVRGDLKLMSIGFFLEENAPIMWRGPMLHKALEQFLSDVHWGEIDTLLVDMPPGTGDVAMSLGQLLPRAEALVVTTPQPAAQQVAVRAAQMALKTGMRVIGAVENMSYLVGTGQELFGSGGGQALADEIGVPLLARIPLDPVLRESADEGNPVLEVAPDSEAAQAIAALAESVAASRAGTIRKPLTLLVSAASCRAPRSSTSIARSSRSRARSRSRRSSAGVASSGGATSRRRPRPSSCSSASARAPRAWVRPPRARWRSCGPARRRDAGDRGRVGRDGAPATRVPGRARGRRGAHEPRRAVVHRLGRAPGDRGRTRGRARLRRRRGIDRRSRGRRLHGAAPTAALRAEKADALGELAAGEGIDLDASTAYSDSASDLPFLEAVGTPVVVNPDRALRKIAAERGWQVRRFRTKAFPGP